MNNAALNTSTPVTAGATLSATAYESPENQQHISAVEQLERLLAADREYAFRRDDIRKPETIALFNSAEVFDYFVDYFINYRASGN